MRVPASRLVVFLSIVGSVVALLHGYAWSRVVHDPAWPAPIAVVLTVLLVALAIFLPTSLVLARTARAPWNQRLGWAGYVWLGAIFYLDVSLLALDLGRALLEGVAYASTGSALPSSEGVGTARALAGAASLLALGLVGMGARRGLGDPIVREVEVPIAGLDPALDGFRIVQLSDVHVGPVIRRAFVERLVAKVGSLAPDLVAITGDLVDGSVAELASEVAPLAELRAPAGVFFVTGNHEYFSGADAWSAHVETLGMTTLRNRHVEIAHAGARFVLAGVDDAHAPRFGGHTDMKAALAGRPPALPVVLLAHQPRSVREAAELGVALQISGHTHGGQMQPFGALVRVEQPFLRGLHRVGETAVWVSEGTGTWGPPLRIGTHSEISVITLRAAEASAGARTAS
ncbi:MAG: metallophosphoesterase [Sandaracinus sp.]